MTAKKDPRHKPTIHHQSREIKSIIFYDAVNSIKEENIYVSISNVVRSLKMTVFSILISNTISMDLIDNCMEGETGSFGYSDYSYTIVGDLSGVEIYVGDQYIMFQCDTIFVLLYCTIYCFYIFVASIHHVTDLQTYDTPVFHLCGRYFADLIGDAQYLVICLWYVVDDYIYRSESIEQILLLESHGIWLYSLFSNLMHTLSRKQIISLSAILMFAPVIHYHMTHRKLDDADYRFARSYVYAGYIVIFLTVSALLVSMVGNYAVIAYTSYVSTALLCIALILMMMGCIHILQDKILISRLQDISLNQVQSIAGSEYLSDLIPGNNLYQRYQGKHQYIIQESIIVWSIYLLCGWFMHSFWFMIWGFIALMIYTTIRLTQDISHNRWTQRVAESFVVNIEEIYGTMLGYIIYSLKYLYSVMSKKAMGQTLSETLAVYQKVYQTLYTLKGNTMLIMEYTILALILVVYIVDYISQTHYDISNRLILIPVAALCGRYLLMFYIDQFVYIPLIHELVHIVHTILTFIFDRHQDENLPS